MSTKISWNEGGSNVIVTGDFDNWQKSIVCQHMDGEHSATITVSSFPIVFKFIVDGDWTLSKKYERVQDHQGNWNNIIRVPDILEKMNQLETKVASQKSLLEYLEQEHKKELGSLNKSIVEYEEIISRLISSNSVSLETLEEFAIDSEGNSLQSTSQKSLKSSSDRIDSAVDLSLNEIKLEAEYYPDEMYSTTEEDDNLDQLQNLYESLSQKRFQLIEMANAYTIQMQTILDYFEQADLAHHLPAVDFDVELL